MALLSLDHIHKRFPGVHALRGVSLEVRAGEVHALVGENGAGKSTLMKILSGLYPPDEGEIALEGQTVRLPTPKAAQRAGIVTIHQEFSLIPALSVAENIFLGGEPLRAGLLDWARMNAEAARLLEQVGTRLEPRTAVERLGVAEQQMVEIARALHQDARLVIMDEPTAALSKREIGELYTVVRSLKARGIAVIFISHHLEEVFDLCDRVTVLRDGMSVGTLEVAETGMNELVRRMVGREIGEQYPRSEVAPGQTLLELRGLTRRDGRVQGVSLMLRAGEILGIGGLMGAGRTELLRAVFGADPLSGGEVRLEGRPLKLRSPHDAVAAGLGLLTEDRKAQGLVLSMSVKDNLTLGVLERLSRGPLLDHPAEARLGERYVRELGIRTPGLGAGVVQLSGGNQQKVLLSRWLARAPKVLMFDEPTRGVDVGAKVEIYRLMNALSESGMGLIVVSSELPELLGLSDRIAVLRGGRLSGELERAQFSQEAVLRLASGLEAARA